jgi:hypothetical protein
MANDDISDLLNKWEEAYKKGLLSFWILLLLYERASYPYEMSAEVAKISQGTISVDDNRSHSFVMPITRGANITSKFA